MGKLYIITGATGHLGNTLIRLLQEKKETVRGLLLPSQDAKDSETVHYYKGDICDLASLEPLFSNTGSAEVIVIHTAGIVSIEKEMTALLYRVNVTGTKHIIQKCKAHHVSRLVYVSSVHAIPEKNKFEVLQENTFYSPSSVVGAYAKTKAEATQAVLTAAANGLDTVVVQPSGILGPFDVSGNHLVQLVRDYMNGRLPACVRGGYDFVDVRDVADGCLKAAQSGKTGECYILSNRHYEIKDVLKMVKAIQRHGKFLPTLPMWIAHIFAPIMGAYSKRKKIRPLYTPYSLYALASNDKFSHDKATRELNYHPRDLFLTLFDTVKWIKTVR